MKNIRVIKKAHLKSRRVMRFRQSLFWDVDPKTIHPQRNARYIIERILDFGNDKEVKWMIRYYPRELIRDVVMNSRGILPQTYSFWQLLTSFHGFLHPTPAASHKKSA